MLLAAYNGDGRAPHANGSFARVGANGGAGAPRERVSKPCTENQVRAIRAIARDLGFDMEQRLREEYGVERPDQLTLAQASALIDSLRAAGAR